MIHLCTHSYTRLSQLAPFNPVIHTLLCIFIYVFIYWLVYPVSSQPPAHKCFHPSTYPVTHLSIHTNLFILPHSKLLCKKLKSKFTGIELFLSISNLIYCSIILQIALKSPDFTTCENIFTTNEVRFLPIAQTQNRPPDSRLRHAQP
jgi:hypothetical protein